MIQCTPEMLERAVPEILLSDPTLLDSLPRETLGQKKLFNLLTAIRDCRQMLRKKPKPKPGTCYWVEITQPD